MQDTYYARKSRRRICLLRTVDSQQKQTVNIKNNKKPKLTSAPEEKRNQNLKKTTQNQNVERYGKIIKWNYAKL